MWLSEDPSDQLPNPPVGLTQLEFDEVTEIPVGGATDEQVVLFRGEVSDPDGDMVLLQIELRRLEELGGEFDEGDASGLRRSDLVESGSEAIVYAENLIPDHYHWATHRKPISQYGPFGSLPRRYAKGTPGALSHDPPRNERYDPELGPTGF